MYVYSFIQLFWLKQIYIYIYRYMYLCIYIYKVYVYVYIKGSIYIYMLLWQPTWYTWSTAAAHICCDLHEPTLLGKKRTLRSHRTSIHSQATLWLQSVRVQCRQRQQQIYMEPASKRRRAPSTSVHAGWLAFWKKPQKLNPFNLEWHGMTRNA